MTGLQSHARIRSEISRTTNRQDGLLPVATETSRRSAQILRGHTADERDDLMNDAG